MPTIIVNKSSNKPVNAIHKTPTDNHMKDDQHHRTFYTEGMKYVSNNIIGHTALINTPYGSKRMTYADYTASGRNLYMIENYISKYVISYYGNTHTTTSFASMQTSKFREDAKAIIRRSCNASSEDAVIFCGSGATAAIHKLIGVLGMHEPDIGRSSVVFIGPYEHHSNILPWKETGAKIIRIRENSKGELDMKELDRELQRHSRQAWSYIVGTFSACSNVTGILVNTHKVSQLMHQYGGLVFWDYAAGAPYMDIDMNPMSEADTVSAHKDAMFCSPHKFVGGPGSPGLLIAKKALFKNSIPHGTGGGTVVYVTNRRHSYTRDIEAREEGGTPGIIESIRAGLVFQLKASIGSDDIRKREEYLSKKATKSLTENPNIILLGSKELPRVPIISFCVRNKATQKLLHHNYVSLLLNELFGIQVRGGCACAGPYAQDLLGIADEVAEGIMAFLDSDFWNRSSVINEDGTEQPLEQTARIANKLGIMKPGFVRLSLVYFMPDEEVDYILEAINIVAKDGWKLLPQYKYDVEEGSWHHVHFNEKLLPLMSLSDISYNRMDKFAMSVQGVINHREERGKQQSYNQLFAEANKILEKAERDARLLYPIEDASMKDYLPEALLPYVWWLEPRHALLILNRKSTESLYILRTESIPIKPREYNTLLQKSSVTIDTAQRGSSPEKYPRIKLKPEVDIITDRMADDSHKTVENKPTTNYRKSNSSGQNMQVMEDNSPSRTEAWVNGSNFHQYKDSEEAINDLYSHTKKKNPTTRPKTPKTNATAVHKRKS